MIAVSHQTVAGIMMEASKRNIRIPDDLTVISLDGHPLGTILDITTVGQPVEELGRQAFRMLYKLLEKNEYKPERAELPYQLVERSTV